MEAGADARLTPTRCLRVSRPSPPPVSPTDLSGFRKRHYPWEGTAAHLPAIAIAPTAGPCLQLGHWPHPVLLTTSSRARSRRRVVEDQRDFPWLRLVGPQLPVTVQCAINSGRRQTNPSAFKSLTVCPFPRSAQKAGQRPCPLRVLLTAGKRPKRRRALFPGRVGRNWVRFAKRTSVAVGTG